MQAAYINQNNPQRATTPRLLNQALNSPNHVTLVRTPARTVRQRRPALRAQHPQSPQLQGAQRLLNPQMQQALNSPNHVTLVRTPARTVRQRRPALRAQHPQSPQLQGAQRLLNPQMQQVRSIASLQQEQSSASDDAPAPQPGIEQSESRDAGAYAGAHGASAPARIARAASARATTPRLLNQALNSPNHVTLVRTPARSVRQRRPALRAQHPQSPQLQGAQRLLNPQMQQGQVGQQVQSPGGIGNRVGVNSVTSSPGTPNIPGGVSVLNPNAAGTPTQPPTPRGRARGNTPRLLNSHAAHAQHRAARPRTPLLQQQQQQHQQQQHQLTQHLLNQQQQHQQMHSQQLGQLKLGTHQQQIVVNQSAPGQQARIITPQGTIVTQSLQQHTMTQQVQNGPLQHNVLQQQQQRASPHAAAAAAAHQAAQQQQQQVKKAAVLPNNASDMDDLEDSIQAAVLSKHSVNEASAPHPPQAPPQFHSPQPLRNQQMFIQQQPQQAYEQQAGVQQHQPNIPQSVQVSSGFQTGASQLTQLLLEEPSPDDERRLLTLANGHRITLAEYKRLNCSPAPAPVPPPHGMAAQPPPHMHQPRDTARQTLVKSKEQQRPVQRVQPMQTHQQVPQHESNDVAVSGPSEQAQEPQSAKMLIFLQNGEQRLITFTLPKESCTLQEVLEQVNVPFSEDTHIQCMQNTSSEIDYFVSVGSTTRIEEMLENHPMLIGDLSSRSSPSVLSQQQGSEMSTPEKSHNSDSGQLDSSPRAVSPPPKYVEGQLALCKCCGYTGLDFSRCQRCKRVFTEEPKSVPIELPNKKVELKKKEPEKLIEKPAIISEGIKLNLLKNTIKSISNKTPVQAEKKTARPRKPRSKPDPEPVILTLSSDEEDSNSSMISNQQEQSANTKEPTLTEIESGIDCMGAVQIDDCNREEISSISGPGIVTLNCRTIRIGSYRYTPKEKIYISSKGIKIVAPNLKNESRDVALQIQLREVVKILVHFGKGLPVIFLYTVNRCGAYIRRMLDMTEELGPYYNPMSKNDPYKRITLLPDLITEEAKGTMKSLFGRQMDELNSREANEILVRTCPKESNNSNKMATRSSTAANSSGAKSSGPAEIRQILIYPPGKGGIPINTEDYMCLAQDQFLNDVIIDFYLKHLLHEVLTHSQREKTHIFSTFFYKRLTTKPSKVNRCSNPHEWDSNLTPAQKRHLRVKTWTKNVNIFDKDFIVVPINENCHWFVAIICFPSLDGCRSMIDNRTVCPQEIKKRERRTSGMQIGNTTITPLTKQEQLTLSCDSDNLSERDEAEGDESDLDMLCDSDEEEPEKPAEEKKPEPQTSKGEPIKQPCILIFDSLAGASRSRVVATLRDYLTCEYLAKLKQSKVFNKDNIKGACPKIPQQNNFTDCGLYLLQYVEHFFKDPILDYSFPIKQLANWFDEIVVTRKREEISILLKTLMDKYNPDSHMTLPDITFPTLNGKLIETEEQQEDGDSDKGATSTSKKDSKDNDGPTLTFVKHTPTGDIVVKRNFPESSETIHVRKTIRLSNDAENRSMLQLKSEFIKKGDNENQILIPIKLHTSDLVKDIQNTLIVNKNNKTLGDKKQGVHNQNVSSLNCVRQTVSEGDGSSFLKARRVNKLEDVVTDSSKKFKRNEC
ncbi:hypothetical protein O0L34_g16339 [Tuta absoluta]|nr:hypothetical protein O0L34_g16339 [Tuta absoluta]